MDVSNTEISMFIWVYKTRVTKTRNTNGKANIMRLAGTITQGEAARRYSKVVYLH